MKATLYPAMLALSAGLFTCSPALSAEPPPSEQLQEAIELAESQQGRKALTLFDSLIARDAAFAEAYYWRGRERFKLGHIKQSLADFDRFVELRPNAASRQWERGITCYYAGEFKKGAEQFKLYQSYHDQDVENSVWRYLCVVPSEGVEKARKNMLPIDNDPRVPMMEIYELFRGNKTPDDVFAAAKAGKPSEASLKTRLFYANLYVGLYYESLGKPELAKPHIVDAAEKYRISHYMGDVAHIHAQRLNQATDKP